MDLSSVKIVECMSFIEIGLPLAKANSKTERGLRNFLNNVATFFALNVGILNDGIDVHYGQWEYGDFIQINDFGYSCNNECSKSKTCRVFRGFGLSLYCIRPVEEKQFFFGTYRYTVKGCEVHAVVSGHNASNLNWHSPKRREVLLSGFSADFDG